MEQSLHSRNCHHLEHAAACGAMRDSLQLIFEVFESFEVGTVHISY
jgi:hypothetical protein